MELKELVTVCEQLIQRTKLDEALNLYTNWINHNIPNELIPSNDKALAYNNRGHVLYFKVEFEDAIKNYNEALKYDSNFPAAYYNRGTIMYRMGYFMEAMIDMVQATSLVPTNEEYKLGLDRCKQRLSNNN